MAGKWARYVAAFIAGSGLFTVVACSGHATGGSSSTTFCNAITVKLRGCGLLSPGVLGCEEPQTAEDRCTAGCLISGSCDDLRSVFCSSSSVPPAGLVACVSACSPTDFRCADGTTVSASYRCDLYPDCSDGSDESGCPGFDCGDGTTVPESFQCDAFPDCSNGRDESTCPTFQCGSGETVPADWKCDGAQDCSDGSDEAGCPEIAQITC